MVLAALASLLVMLAMGVPLLGSATQVRAVRAVHVGCMLGGRCARGRMLAPAAGGSGTDAIPGCASCVPLGPPLAWVNLHLGFLFEGPPPTMLC